MGAKERTYGFEPAIVDLEDDREVFLTTYGSIELLHSTGDLIYACVTLSSQLSIKIINNQFCVWVQKSVEPVSNCSGRHSSSYSLEKSKGDLSVVDIVNYLILDDNYSPSGAAVKRTLVKLIEKHLNLDKEEKQALKGLRASWRIPVKITRIPIKGGDIMENSLHRVQMIHDNYDIIHNPLVKEKYPELHKEVCEHDSKSSSSWYQLTKNAYLEHKQYITDKSIGYVK